MPPEKQSGAVVIVGGTGLIGSALVKRLAERRHVLALDNDPPKGNLPSNAEFIRIDVTRDDSVARAFEQIGATRLPIASVIQLAAYYDFAGEPSDLYEKVTVRGTERVLREARKLSAEQFIFSSTMLVHAPTAPGRPIDETHPLDAKWDYPQSKIQTEELIRREAGDMPCVLLRIAGVYTDTCDSIPLAHQLQRIEEKRLTSHVYPGDISKGQAFVHLEDALEAFRLCVERRHDLPQGIEPLLIGEPVTYSYDRLQREFARLLHGDEDWETREIPKTLAKTGAWLQDKVPGVEDPFIKPWMIDLADDHYELDIHRAAKQLGWHPRRRLIDTLPKMVAALRGDPAGWYERHKLELPEGAGRNR